MFYQLFMIANVFILSTARFLELDWLAEISVVCLLCGLIHWHVSEEHSCFSKRVIRFVVFSFWFSLIWSFFPTMTAAGGLKMFAVMIAAGGLAISVLYFTARKNGWQP